MSAWSVLYKLSEVLGGMTTAGRESLPEDKPMIEHGTNSELSVRSCLKGMGISLLSECDVLAFMYRCGTSLMSAGDVARLIGYDSAIVGAAIERLERQRLIERSRPSQGRHIYQLAASTVAGRRDCIQQLVNVSESRAGRFLLAKILNPVHSATGEEK
jgi:DNA-binding MarR family transcriptional regulator